MSIRDVAPSCGTCRHYTRGYCHAPLPQWLTSEAADEDKHTPGHVDFRDGFDCPAWRSKGSEQSLKQQTSEQVACAAVWSVTIGAIILGLGTVIGLTEWIYDTLAR